MKLPFITFNSIPHLSRRCFYTFILLFFICEIFAQGLMISYDAKEINACTKYRKSAPLLVESLTAGKGSDKEKFDAIFAWVALNIEYNYTTYYSNQGTFKPDLKSVLKNKSGICLDYANLMDSLCKLAGLKNFTVCGYTKDELFDINDSLYFDDHAWNAVNLDGNWYLYDVTWASGRVDIDLTKFSKKLVKWVERFPYKTKKIVLDKKKYAAKKDVCGEALDDSSGTFEFSYKKYKHNWLRKILLKFKLKYKRIYNHSLDTSFYLNDPEVFGITHFPNDPTWALSTRTYDKFIRDSTYYYLTENTFKEQTPSGKSCPHCDEILNFEEKEFHLDLLNKSTKSNERNAFVPFLCDFSLARVWYFESLPVEDSLSKIKLLDTSLAMLKIGEKNLEKSLRNAGIYFGKQRTKNATKKRILVNNNKAHKKYAFGLNSRSKKKLSDLEKFDKHNTKIRNKYIKKSHEVNSFIIEQKSGTKKANPKFEEELKLKQKGIKAKRDSINYRIDSLKTHLANELEFIRTNFIYDFTEIKAFLEPVLEKYNHRSSFLDDYKKEVIECEKTINSKQKLFLGRMDSTLFFKTDSLIEGFKKLEGIISTRNKLELEIYSNHTKLTKINGEELSAYQDDKYYWLEEIKEDYCWLRKRQFYIDIIKTNYAFIKIYMENANKIYKLETDQESVRFKYVNKELARRLYKTKNIINGNKRVNRALTSEVKTNKKEYLKMLKEEAKKAKAVSKK